LLAWPSCPSCDHQLITLCPACKINGVDFPPAHGVPERRRRVGKPQAPEPENADSRDADSRDADSKDADSQEADVPLFVLCPTCDEAFEPEFYRRGAWCNHDFGPGLEADPPVQIDPDLHLDNSRAVVLATVLAVVLVGTVALVFFA
ncbi:MAG: hypothetical protein N2C14_03010, partial [Planctomycetales bacterium]